MRLTHFVAALSLSASALASAAQAVPFATDTRAANNIELVSSHNSCHSNTRNHRHSELGGARIDHYHRPSDCRAIPDDEEEEDDCHSAPDAHPLGGRYGRGDILHRHRRDCSVVILEEERDCHRDVQRHRLDEFGGRRVWHSHSGRSCRVDLYEEFRGDTRGQNCVNLGGIRLCTPLP